MPKSVDPIRLSPLLQAPAAKSLKRRENSDQKALSASNGSNYEAGERSGAWIQHLTDREQKSVIGGYVLGAHGFDALPVGVNENKTLIFVAKVKKGFVSQRKEIFSMVKKFDTSNLATFIPAEPPLCF